VSGKKIWAQIANSYWRISTAWALCIVAPPWSERPQPSHMRPAVLLLNRSIDREIVSKLDAIRSFHHIDS
jgi:hypothetical protein